MAENLETTHVWRYFSGTSHEVTGLKVGFPDCHWPDCQEKPIETNDSMQKVSKNSRQSFKKSDNFWEKYPS